MRNLQAAFPRLKDRLVFENFGERKRIMKSIILLNNYRSRKVGINQLKNTYYASLEVDANVFYADEIFK